MQIRGFDDAFTLLMGHEGGYVNHPEDPGGETMFGITKRVAVANGYTGPMRDLPLSIAKRIAKNEYWDRWDCDLFHPEIGFQIFDTAYNGGKVGQWVQLAAGVTPDGVIGAKTLAAVQQLSPAAFTARFSAYRLRYLASLKTWPSFGRGWCNRIAANLLEGAD
jgi:lysozyme family protein